MMIDPIESAKEAGLKYVTDSEPGIRRKKRGKGFTYQDEKSGSGITKESRERIDELVIPPAWQNVWIFKSRASMFAKENNTAITRNGMSFET
jgi:DNA topoisomerase I